MKAIYENHYLTDKDVANFARQSFGKLSDEFSDGQNHNLIRFLARGMSSGDWKKLIDKMISVQHPDHALELANYLRSIPEHWVPFGHPQVSLRMSAPVPIARQSFKHKIGFVESEESRRYISSEPVFYIPDDFRMVAENVKQGSAGPHPDSDSIRAEYVEYCELGVSKYLDAIARKVCPEQARFFLPQGCEVNWLWTGSLYAFANFFIQRTDSHAQLEIQELARQVGDIIEPLYPVSWRALTHGG